MAPPATPLQNLCPRPPRYVVKLTGRLIIMEYLLPKVFGGYINIDPGVVEEGVDVIACGSPAELLFHPVGRTGHGKVWGYFYGHYPIDCVRWWPVQGGWWMRYGPDKEYKPRLSGVVEAIGFRRRFAFRASRWGADGIPVLLPTPWLMKEYRLNKGAAANRYLAARAQAYPWANMDCVVRKLFAKLPPPFVSATVRQVPGGGQDAGYASDKESRTRSPPDARTDEEPGSKRARLV